MVTPPPSCERVGGDGVQHGLRRAVQPAVYALPPLPPPVPLLGLLPFFRARTGNLQLSSY